MENRDERKQTKQEVEGRREGRGTTRSEEADGERVGEEERAEGEIEYMRAEM